MLGRPAICEPLWKNVIAGSWLMASVYIERTMQRSSTTLAVCGSRSLTQVPFAPWRLNPNRDPASGSDAWLPDMPVSRCPWRTESGSCSPLR